MTLLKHLTDLFQKQIELLKKIKLVKLLGIEIIGT